MSKSFLCHILVFVFVVFSALGAESGVVEADLVGHKFILREVDGESFAAEPAPVIEFGDGLALHGKICNGFRGKAELIDGLLRVDGVISTRMLCVNNDLSIFETRFLRLLESGLVLELDGDYLFMRAVGAELKFELVIPGDELQASLSGRKFILDRVGGDEFRVERQPFIEFGQNMRVTGSACNNFMGPGELRDGVLMVKNAAATMMMCVDPKLSKFEADFHRLLREGVRVQLDGKTLTLTGDGLTLVYLEAEPNT